MYYFTTKNRLARVALTLLVAVLGFTGAWAQEFVDGARYTPYYGFQVMSSDFPNAWSSGGNGTTPAEKLFDGDKSTKWIYVPGNSNPLPTLTIVFRIATTSNDNIPVIKGYVLVTGDDTETYPNRNPTSWTLSGSNYATGPWTEIDSRSNNDADRLPKSNLAEKSYLIPNNYTPYSYYRLEITGVYSYETQSGGNNGKYICQLNEMVLFGNPKQYDNYNINNCTISVQNDPLTWTGAPISTLNSSISYSLTDSKWSNQPVNSNYYSGYFYTTTGSNTNLTNLTDAGFYKLTVVGRDPYSGEKSIKFGVAKESLDGAGTEESPYLINNLTDWNTFAVKVVYDNANYGDKYYKLTADLTGVTAMVGSSAYPFKGHFDGDGHTLNVNLSADGICCAPFRYVQGTSSSNPASIRRLRTTGTVTAGSEVLDDMNMYCSGLIGECRSYVNIDNCWSSVAISSSLAREGGHGGFIGKLSSPSSGPKITNCLFDGSITGSTTTRCGGFVGGADNNVTIKNCLMRGTLSVSIDANDNKNSATFSRATINTNSSSKYYYVTAYGTAQGTAVGTMDNGELLAELGNLWEIVNDEVVPIIDTKNLTLGSLECDDSFQWTGQELNVAPVVKDMDGNVVAAANYTVSFSPNAVVQDPADYTMTVEGNSATGYRGSLTHQFMVSAIPVGMYIDEDFNQGETGYYAVNMPKSGTTTLDFSNFNINTFKVYDDGGKAVNFSKNCNGYIKIIAPEGRLIRISGNVMCNSSSYFTVYNGGTDSSSSILGKSRFGSLEGDDGESVGTLTTTGQEMLLYFKTSNSSTIDTNPGLNLTVTLINASTEYDIAVVNPDTEKGTLSVSPTSAAANSDITVTVNPANSYKLCDLQATDAFGNVVDLSHLLWYNNTNTGTFKMASSDVTITPTFTNVWTAEGGLYINMPKSNSRTNPLSVNITAETPTVKIYDDGGKDHNYSNNCGGYLLLTAPEGKRLKLIGTVSLGSSGSSYDRLIVYDGTSNSSTKLGDINGTDGNPVDIGTLVSSGTQMLIYFRSLTDFYAGLDLTLSLYDPDANYSITVNNPEAGGTVTASADRAMHNAEITLTISPDQDYVLESLEVKDTDGHIVSTGDWTWYNRVGNQLTFTMSSCDVTVTPTFSKCPTVNMANTGNNVGSATAVTIPAGLPTFKVYDDGGEDGYYSNSFNGYMQLTAPAGYRMRVRGTVKTKTSYDYLNVYAGNTTTTQLGNFYGTQDVDGLVSPGNELLLYFHSDNSSNDDGFELSVTVFNPNTQNDIVVVSQEGGAVSASPTPAAFGQEITLTITPAGKYALESLDVKDANGYTVSGTDFNWYNCGSNPTFNMVETEVTITPAWSTQPTINFPKSNSSSTPLAATIPDNVESIKVYDDGGIDGSYSANCNGYLLLTAPQGKLLKVTGTMDISKAWLYVYDGSTTSKQLGGVGDNSEKTLTVGPLTTTDNQMLLNFYSFDISKPGLDLTVTVVDPDATNYVVVNNTEPAKGSVTASPNTAKAGTEVTVSVFPATGYVMESLSVKDIDNQDVAYNWSWYDGTNEATFTMPLSNVTVIPKFTDQPSVNMLDEGTLTVGIPSKITSIKVYDWGGEEGNTGYGESYLLLNAPNNCRMMLSGSVNTYTSSDYLHVYDGNNTDAQLGSYSNTKTVDPIFSSGNQVLLYFRSYSNYTEGFDLTVTVLDLDTEYDVTVNNAVGGTVTADPTKGKYNDEITLTIATTGNYLLKDLTVKDANLNAVDVTDALWYTGATTATFTMPYFGATVTPVFTDGKTIDAGLYVNMPANTTAAEPKTVTIPAGVKAFKVYDDGGVDGLNTAWCDGYLLLVAPEGCVLHLTGTVDSNSYETSDCCLKVYDGSTTDNSLGKSYYSGSGVNIGALQGTCRYMLLNYDSHVSYNGIDLTVEVMDTSIPHAVSVDEVAGGTVVAAPTSAVVGTPITLTITPDNTYMLSELVVKDADQSPVEVSDARWYTGATTATFTMPYLEATVTPTFTNNLTAEGGLYVNMPAEANTVSSPMALNIPAGVTSFKVYDNGGKDGKTSGGYKYYYMLLTAPSGYMLQLNGKVKGYSNKLTVYDGDTEATRIGNAQYGNGNGDGEDIGTLYSSGNKMLLRYYDAQSGEVGLDLKVTLIDASIAHNVVVNNPQDGHQNSVTANPTSATPNTTITLTANTEEGYILSDCIVTDGNSNNVELTGGKWYSGSNIATFTMPASDASVTPTFTNSLTAEGGLYVNMPKYTNGKNNAMTINVPDGVTSFKIYDDGGASGYYSNDCNGYLLITVPEGNIIQLTGTVNTDGSSDYLEVYNGFSASSNDRLGYSHSAQDIGILTSTGTQMTLRFYTNYATNKEGLNLTATVISATTEFDVTVNTTGSGSVDVPAKVTVNSEVTLTATPSTGYILNTLSATDAKGKSLAELVWYNETNTATFNMPASDVTVTSTFTNDLTAEGGLFVNMPNYNTKDVIVPEGVTSFNVYDNGGKDGNYSSSCNGYMQITAPAGSKLQLTGTVKTNRNDYLTVYDGNTTSNSNSLGKFSNKDGVDIGTLNSTANQMRLYFHSEYSSQNEGLELKVTVIPPVTLADKGTDNSATIAANDDSQPKNVVLSNRKLFKDGEWNTICLPFNLTLEGSPLEGADVRELITEEVNGTVTGLANGVLTLNFTGEKAITQLVAGKPYIIKWAEDTEHPTIDDPVFTGVTIDKTDRKFIGTGFEFKGNYDYQSFTDTNPNILLLGIGNKLYYPDGESEIGACRAYFEITNGTLVRAFKLNFGDGESQGIKTIDYLPLDADCWYTVNGVKVDKPTRKGLYIRNGRKVVIR